MRFISTTLAFLVIFQGIVLQVRVPGVAAQDIQQSQGADAPSKSQSSELLRITDGTLVEIEAPYTFNSMDFKPEDQISFRVVNPVKVNGVTIIEQGAVATGRIDRAKRGGHFGKAGLFVFTMQSVTAIDGSQIPLRVASVRLRGDSKGATVATKMIITGALLPIIAPVALLHGFKRGKDAFIPAGKRYEVYVNGQPTIRITGRKF